jgi:non-canonical purine NTP pyrophosphatase (RdgB/HAM1 family)
MPDVTEGASDDGRIARWATPDPAGTPAGRDPVLVLGTTNAGKVRELLALVAPHGLTCRSLSEMAGAVEVDETGATFAENAALKAVMQARALGHWVLAEDSGLVVPALDGEPGVRSARFAGPPAPGDGTPADERNNRLLLDRLAGMSGRERSAWYACHAVLADPTAVCATSPRRSRAARPRAATLRGASRIRRRSSGPGGWSIGVSSSWPAHSWPTAAGG